VISLQVHKHQFIYFLYPVSPTEDVLYIPHTRESIGTSMSTYACAELFHI